MAASVARVGRIGRRAQGNPRRRASVPAVRRSRTPQRARHTRVVELGRAARHQLTRRNLIAGAALLFALLLHVYAGLWVGELTYEISNAHQVQGRLESEKQQLRVELTSAIAPGRLEEIAHQRLGLGPPAPGQVVILP